MNWGSRNQWQVESAVEQGFVGKSKVVDAAECCCIYLSMYMEGGRISRVKSRLKSLKTAYSEYLFLCCITVRSGEREQFLLDLKSILTVISKVFFFFSFFAHWKSL